MKRNLISVLILALCVVNLILNAVLLFVCMPSATKTNRLIKEIASVLSLDLELEKKQDEIVQVDLQNVAYYNIEPQVVNLKDDGSGKGHFVQVGIDLSLDKSKKDYKKLEPVLPEAEGVIYDEVRNIIQVYTYDQVSDPELQEQIKRDILKRLQEKFQTQCIYSVSFSKFTTQ